MTETDATTSSRNREWVVDPAANPQVGEPASAGTSDQGQAPAPGATETTGATEGSPAADVAWAPPVGDPRAQFPSPREADQTVTAAPTGPPLKISVEVVWGEIVNVKADLHVVGQYRGVVPGNSLRSLDRAISRVGGKGVIAEHIRRRTLRGEFGEVDYFPAPRGGLNISMAAVAGMGRPGAFTADRAKRLFESLLGEAFDLPDVSTLAITPIGVGANNLSATAVGRAIAAGFRIAISKAAGSAPVKVLIVEPERLLAEQIRDALDFWGGEQIEVGKELTRADGARVGPEAAAVHGLRAVLDQVAAGNAGARSKLMHAVPSELRAQVWESLQYMATSGAAISQVSFASVGTQVATDLPPSRVAALSSDGGISWSAVTNRSTVPERFVNVNAEVLGDLVERMSPPNQDDGAHLPAFLTRLLVPRDLRFIFSGEAAVILEVDSATSCVPWEFVECDTDDFDGGSRRPLVLRQAFARQLKTTYARTDVDELDDDGLQALVIGDPGDPAHSLPAARAEALAVAEVLRARGVKVDLFLGCPEDPPTPGARPATRLDVLSRLISGNYEIVHYAGHGTFDRDNPTAAGWVFSDGILAATEVTAMDVAPRLVIANACWSMQGVGAGGANEQPVAVLADEFMRTGAGHVIGATWQLPDEEAATFARSFYDLVLPADGQPALPIGQALLAVRQWLWSNVHDADGKAEIEDPVRLFAWAAYQHYGDPADTLIPR